MSDGTDSKEVELTEKNALSRKQNGEEKELPPVKITCWTHVGWDGIVVMLFSFAIAALFVFITYLYTNSFTAWYRPLVWLLMVVALLYVLLVAKYLST